MDKKVGKKLRKDFEEQLAARLPQFHPITHPRVPPGSRLFEWRINDGLCAYLLLFVDPKGRDSFTIEVAWSMKGKFPGPRPTMHPFPISRSRIKADSPIDGEFYTRIGSLREPFRDYWWAVTNREESVRDTSDDSMQWVFNPPPLVDYVEGCVKDAIDRIVRDAIPYLESVANTYPQSEKSTQNSEIGQAPCA